MSKKCCKSHSHKLESCGCPTPRMCCGSMAVPTTAYNMVSVPQLVYDNVPASSVGGFGPNYGVGGVSNYGGNDGCGFGGGGCSWIIIIILLLCFCGGSGFGGGHGHGDDCGCGDGFGGSWIIIIILLLCFCGGSGFGY